MATILFLSDGYVFFFYLLVVLLLRVGRYGFSCHVDSKFHMMIFYGVNSSDVKLRLSNVIGLDAEARG